MTELEKQMYWSKIPEVLQDNENFHVFMELAVEEFRIDLANIERFTDLIDPDKVPIQFIEALGGVVGFEDNVNSDEFSREALQRIQSVYSMRGTDKSILMSANHGGNEGWLGGQLFIPGYTISSEDATIIFTAEKIFTHSRSKFSGGDVYSDGSVYRSGVIMITVPYIDDRVRKAVLSNVPAGVKYYFKIENYMNPIPEEAGEYGEMSLLKSTGVLALTSEEILGSVQPTGALDAEISITYTAEATTNALIRSGLGTANLRSGSQIIRKEYGLEVHMGASGLSISMLGLGLDSEEEVIVSETGEVLDTLSKAGSVSVIHDLDREVLDMSVLSQCRTIPQRSTLSAVRSSQYVSSGLFSNWVDGYVLPTTNTASNFMGNASELLDSTPYELEGKYTMGEIEVDLVV